MMRRIHACLPFAATMIVMVARLPADEFPNISNSQAEDIALSSHAAAVGKLKHPAGFQATLFAAEPDVQQPIACTTDERGRLWVAENYTYSESSVNFDTSLRDRVIILADNDNDGRFDERKVFWDAGIKLTSVEIGFGGVWVLCAPQLLFIPDRNRDDIPDGPPEVVLDGWDQDAVRHNIVNGLRWGPDGWLYGRHGIMATSMVGVPGATTSQRTAMNCGIWRYHPVRKTFEVVASGTTNPWGFDYDDYGEMFMINTVIGHLWHIVPGAYFERMYGSHDNPHLYRLITQTADHYHWDVAGEAWHELKKTGMTSATDAAGGGHAHCGLMVYLGANWPDQYRNGLFTLNLHGLRINHDTLHREGNGYVGRHAADFLKTDDPWFRGIELVYGPDGGVFILDWSDIGECHENDGVHRTSGRIYKVKYTDGDDSPNGKHTDNSRSAFAGDLGLLSGIQLARLQTHRNDWFVRQARRLLMERATGGQDLTDAIAALHEVFNGNTGDRIATVPERLRAMWALSCMGAIDEDWLLKQLLDDDEHLRSWAVRLLSDSPGGPSAHSIRRMTEHARSEPSGLVRLYLASALKSCPLDMRPTLAAVLADYEQDAADRMQPLMIWYGMEPAVTTHPEEAIRLAGSSRMPLLREFIARRLANDIEPHAAPVANLLQLAANSLNTAQRHDVLTGISDGLKGWRKAPRPADWDTIAAKLNQPADAANQEIVRELGVVFGDGRALGEVVRIARDADSPVDARERAIAVLVQNKPDDLFRTLKSLIDDRVVADAAIIALSTCDDAVIPRLILDRYARLSPAGKSGAIDTLVSRPAFAKDLLDAVEQGRVDRQSVSAFHARQIASFDVDALNQKLEHVWGRIRQTSAERHAEIAALRQRLQTDTSEPDAAHGRFVFHKNCANCHTLFGTGGNIGPDLTGANRRNIDYMLENILDPSASVATSFRMSILALTDGRVLNGVVLDRDERILTLQTQKEKLTLPLSDIEEEQSTTASLMPDGILKPLNATDVRDLFSYLMSPHQIPLTDTHTPEPGHSR